MSTILRLQTIAFSREVEGPADSFQSLCCGSQSATSLGCEGEQV
jgi:hypothetical protein